MSALVRAPSVGTCSFLRAQAFQKASCVNRCTLRNEHLSATVRAHDTRSGPTNADTPASSSGTAVAAKSLDLTADLPSVNRSNDGISGPGGKRQVVLLTIVPNGGASPLGPSWQEVMTHMSDKLAWTDPSFRMQVRTEEQLLQDAGVREAAAKADIVLAIGVRSPEGVAALDGVARPDAVQLAFDSAPELEEGSRMQGYRLTHPPAMQQLLSSLPWGPAKKAAAAATAVRTFWDRASSDDLMFMFLTLIDAFFAEVPTLQNMRAQNLGTIVRMIQKCGPQIFACVNDPDCKAALDCLNACDPTDQVAQYRCICSHESKLLEEFSLCILQKNNCLGLSAEPPALPAVQPMKHFQGEQLTHEAAERIFIGWLGKKQWSWRVVAGQNAAYDQFPCQYQIYYKQQRGKGMWYDPVFRVHKFDGTSVWRRRHYRVRRGKAPGTFHLSVLDNGVTSNEYWRIVDCMDDLSWALFYYAGAASAAGQSYSGAVLVTPDGDWPAQEHRQRLTAAFDAAGIKEWEMYRVDNASCDGAPLELPPIAQQPDAEAMRWS